MTIRGGVTAATLASGPVFVLTAAAAEWSRTGNGMNVEAVTGLIVLGIFFGAIAGFIPNWLGAYALAAAGRDNIGLRLPILWLLVGSGAGAAIGALFSGADGAALMAVVGSICAGICRMFTRWDD